MKKIVSVCLSLLLCLSVMPAFAASVWGGLNTSSNSYDVPEMEVSLSVPEDMLVFTRDMPEDAPALAQLGITKAQLDEIFSNGSIYFNAVNPENRDEIVCVMTANNVENFDQFTAEELEAMIPTLQTQYESIGATLVSCEVIQHPQTLMFKILFNHSGTGAQGLQFYTIRNFKALNFTLHAYSGEITPEYEQMMEEIVASIEFKK